MKKRFLICPSVHTKNEKAVHENVLFRNIPCQLLCCMRIISYLCSDEVSCVPFPAATHDIGLRQKAGVAADGGDAALYAGEEPGRVADLLDIRHAGGYRDRAYRSR